MKCTLLLCVALSVAAASPVFAQTDYKPDAAADPKAARLFNQSPETYIPENAYAPEWDTVRYEDVLWKKRVWRTIDLTDPANQLLSTAVLGQNVAEVLMTGVRTAGLKAYSNRMGRWNDEISPTDAGRTIAGSGADARWPGYQTAQTPGSSADKVTTLRLYEDWVYIASKKQLVVRIIGLAPVVPGSGAAGDAGEPAFWIYYPYARRYLAQQRVTGATGGKPLNLDEVFELRRFAGKIEQVRNY